jgi:hypothetical protein
VAVSKYATFQGQVRSPVRNDVASLDAVVSAVPKRAGDEPADTEDGLFALPLSPRSPDMKKSPFSLLT